ncbi:MAG: formylmethanofuran dehydrogenase subunit A [Methanospirillaceae archaeon]|nr:formylmethanofuran dehydrogenase subunit A [Methanospirillaceae archaeon]
MNEILLKNACVIDPIHGIRGEVMDLCIRDGWIVEEVSSTAPVLDAKGYLTMAGAIDSHSHICGTKVNFGRYMSPNDMRAGREASRGIMHPISGYSVPTTYANSYRYSAMGYTTILEGAMAPLEARHTHEEFMATPLQDMMANTLFDGNWNIMEAIHEKDLTRAAAIVGWTLSAVKGFGIKLTNPGGTEAWGWGDDVQDIHETVPDFGVTPAEIITTMIQANEMLNLPHSVHLHCNNLGMPGNYATTIETMDLAQDKNEKRQTLYLTHVQFHSYGGSTWADMDSRSEAITKKLNSCPQIAIDIGQVLFGRTTTMTADGPMEWRLYTLHHNKWSNHDVEIETGSGIIPVYYNRKNLVNSIMWAIGLELVLLNQNPWKVMMTTDNPNGAPFVRYPEIIALLASQRYRNEVAKTIHPRTEHRVPLLSLDRELDLYEIAIITRAAQARALGILDQGKGHLGLGARADVAVYPLCIDTLDPGQEYLQVQEAFSRTLFTIKGGTLVSRNGEVIVEEKNRTFWVDPQISDEYDLSRDEAFKRRFDHYYSVRMNNYAVQDRYIPRGVRIPTETVL